MSINDIKIGSIVKYIGYLDKNAFFDLSGIFVVDEIYDGELIKLKQVGINMFFHCYMCEIKLNDH